MENCETISVYRNRRTGRLRIQPFARLVNGSSQPFGEQVYVRENATDEELLNALLENLSKNNTQAYDRSRAPTPTDTEWRRELKEDQLISVEHRGSCYRVLPSRRMGNSFGSIDDMIRLVSSEEFVHRGGEIIRRLFDEIP